MTALNFDINRMQTTWGRAGQRDLRTMCLALLAADKTYEVQYDEGQELFRVFGGNSPSVEKIQGIFNSQKYIASRPKVSQNEHGYLIVKMTVISGGIFDTEEFRLLGCLIVGGKPKSWEDKIRIAAAVRKRAQEDFEKSLQRG